jgi:hypothetical protein
VLWKLQYVDIDIIVNGAKDGKKDGTAKDETDVECCGGEE